MLGKQYKEKMVNKSEKERLAVVETQIKSMDSKLDKHCVDQKEDFKTVFEKLDALATKLDGSDNRFAGKWVEKVSIGALVTIMAGLILLAVTGI